MTSRHIIKLGSFTVIFAMLAACNNAIATDKPNSKQEKAKPVTRAECLVLQEKAEKIICLKNVVALKKAALAERQTLLAREKARGKALDDETDELLEEFEKGVLGDKKPD